MTKRHLPVRTSGAPLPTRRRALLLGGAAGTALAAAGAGLSWGGGRASATGRSGAPAAGPRALARPVLGATGLTEGDFASAVSAFGAGELHYTFQPSFKGTWSQWLGAKCTGLSPAHLPLASTKWDTAAPPAPSACTALLDTVPRDGSVRRLVPWQEPEDDFADDPEDFVAVVEKLGTAIGARTDVLLCLDLMTFSLRPSSGRDVTRWISGAADVIGWSVWPKGDDYAGEETVVQKAAALCDDLGKPFAVSSFIMDGNTDDAGGASFAAWTTDFLKDRHAAGRPTDHVVLYTPDTTAPWYTLPKTRAAAKTMITTLRALS